MCHRDYSVDEKGHMYVHTQAFFNYTHTHPHVALLQMFKFWRDHMDVLLNDFEGWCMRRNRERRAFLYSLFQDDHYMF